MDTTILSDINTTTLINIIIISIGGLIVAIPAIMNIKVGLAFLNKKKSIRGHLTIL